MEEKPSKRGLLPLEKSQGVMPVEQAAHNPAVIFHLLPGKVMDKGFINGGPESGEQDVQFLRLDIIPAEPPGFCLIQNGAGGFRQRGYPVMLEI